VINKKGTALLGLYVDMFAYFNIHHADLNASLTARRYTECTVCR